MKFNKWTVGLAAVGVVSLASAARADETKMEQVQTALSNTTLSGYVDTAATWRPNTDQKGGTTHMPVYAFAKNDGFTLNAVDLALDKPMDESPWASGYRVELMMGPDAVGTGGFAGTGTQTAIRNAYLALRTPIGNSGIDWKFGVWDSPLGYESTSDPLNPNYTRSYGYTILPRNYTGVLGNYKVNDLISFQAGIADSSSGADPSTTGGVTTGIESQKSYMGAVTFTAPDSWGWAKGATLNGGVIDSAGSGFTPGYTILHADATVPTPLNALKVGAAFDYDDIHNQGFLTAANTANDSLWVVGVYGSYQFNDKLSLNLRGEHVDASNAGFSSFPYFGGVPGVYAKNNVDEFTATVSYQLWANVLSRAEFRWDHIEHGNAYGVSNTGAADRNNDFMLALNLIYQF